MADGRRPKAQCMTLTLTDIRKHFGATRALDGVTLALRPGPRPCAGGGERRRQEHADARAGRRAACRRRHDGDRRHAVRPDRPARGARSRHRADPPGTLALRPPHGCREHPARPRTTPRRALRPCRRASRGRARARAIPPSGVASRSRCRGSADCGAAGRRDLPGGVGAGTRGADGRAHEQPAARGRRAAVRPHPATAIGWRRGGVHQPLPRGSSGHRRRSLDPA